MSRPKQPKSTRTPKPSASLRVATGTNASRKAPQPPPPSSRFFVRCTFVGEDKKVRVEGSFRFIAEARELGAALALLEKAVKKLRRTKDLPPRCDVYVEFVLELATTKAGLVADFERWQRDPRRFQTGHITLSDHDRVFTDGLPIFRFGHHADAPGETSGR